MKVTFRQRSEFSDVLKERVENYFQENGIAKTGNWRMFAKSAVILAWLVASYILLVFFSASLIMAIISAFLVAQGFVLVGFNIMHDGNHGSYSSKQSVNRIMGFTIDLIGGSNHVWRQKHNVLHHTYTNIDELDDDIQSDNLLRLSPEQPWKPWHRFQHLYFVPLYSLLTLSWMTYADFRKVFSGKIRNTPLKKMPAPQMTMFIITKIFYFSYMLVLPSLFHPFLYVLAGFVAVHLVLGLTLSIIFQLAHTVEHNTFPEPHKTTGQIDNEWAIHQVETTSNFATRSWLASWYLGGLNFQIEHHLFTKVCHIHYPAISKIVEKTCQEFSVPYIAFPTIRSAVASHYRFLKQQGAAA